MDALEQLRTLRQSLPANTDENRLLREDMLVEARRLMLDLERPDNAVERLGFGILEPVVLSTAIKMGLLQALDTSSTGSVGDLAAACNADPLLVGRILRFLASYGAVSQTSVDVFAPAIVSKAFTEPRNQAGLETCLEFLAPGWMRLPGLLQERGWINPKDSRDNAMARAWNKTEGTGLFEILVSSPHLAAFNLYMSSFNEGHRDWTAFYPVSDRLGRGARADPDAVMMVDVGGGLGHQAQGVRAKFPQLAGRFVVQDLAQGLPKEPPAGVECMRHDFFDEQPVKGARLYYLRYVMHDWSQDDCARICARLREAMEPGYSRLVVHEWVVPAAGATSFMTAQDINLMAATGCGMERTEALHREYLRRAGLRVVKVYEPGDRISEAVIECEVE